MVDFQNHRFSFRCLSQDIIPVSIRLRSNIKTPRGLYFIKRAERSLLNERIGLVNNTINMLKIQIDTCMNQLKSSLEEKTMEECENFIIIRRESTHIKTLERQILKLEQLCHKNKMGGGCSNYQEKQDGHSNFQDKQDNHTVPSTNDDKNGS